MKKAVGILICLLLIFENISVFAQGDAVTEEVYTLSFGEPSSLGYSDYKWLDENGNEVSFEDGTEKTVRTRAVLPSRYNNSELGFDTSVKNQGNAGSCWAFACVAAAESNLLKKNAALPQGQSSFDFSEAHHVWFTQRSLVNDPNDPTSGDGPSVESPYEKGGNWLKSTFSLSRGSGFTYDSDYPFYPYDLSSMGNYSESARYESKYRLLDSYLLPDSDSQAIKQAIMQNGSVTASYYMTNDYLTGTSNNYCYYCPEENNTNHMITVVGWDDNYAVSNFKKATPSSKGAWIVKNSWGTSWGNEGYFYLSYCDKTLTRFRSVDVEKADSYQTTYQYDGFGYGISISSSSGGSKIKTASFGNVFTAKNDEIIHCIGFYTVRDDVSYTISVYTSLPSDYSDPVNGGTCAVSKSGTAAYQGYHTVDLGEYVNVKQGEIFSAVVTITCDVGAYFPVEGAADRSSSLRQSYYTFGSTWYDASAKGRNNVCVKAFASLKGSDEPVIEDEYIEEIGTPQELAAFANSVNSSKTYEGRTVTLTSDIDMTGVAFNPIGSEENPFEGTFNGDGKVIRNLSISSPSSDNVGLFGTVGSSGAIKAVGLENINVTGKNNVGGLAGYSMSESIINCHCKGNVTGVNNVGGLIGRASGNQVYNNYCITDVEGTQNVGGLIGCDESTVTKYCYSISDVTAQTAYGTFVGYAGSSYTCCYTTVSVNSTGNEDLISGISTKPIEDFKNGNTAYFLKSYSLVYYPIFGTVIAIPRSDVDGYYWTQGENYPVLSTDPKDIMHFLTVIIVKDDSPTTEQITVYLTENDDPQKKVSDLFDRYYCTLYNDSDFTKDPFSGSVTTDDKTLYAKLDTKMLRLVDGSDYEIRDGLLLGVEQGTFVYEIRRQFKNSDSVRISTHYDWELDDDYFVGTGYKVCILNDSGEVLDELVISIPGEVTSDGFVDAFDVVLTMDHVNNFTQPEEPAYMKAADMYEDGFLDATDIAYIIYVANFEDWYL